MGGTIDRPMAPGHHLGVSLRASILDSDENKCLIKFGMLPLHRVFEIVGSQLTDTDIEVLSFLLNEAFPASHPLDPAGWTREPGLVHPEDKGVSPSPELLKAWRRLKPKSAQAPCVASYKLMSGPEVLLELERRGYLSEGNLEPLLQLLRVQNRHDLLPLVSYKKRRTVSPERTRGSCEMERRELVFTSGFQGYRQTEIPLPPFTQALNTSINPPMNRAPAQRRKKKRGYGWSRKPKRTSGQTQQPLPPTPKVSCNIQVRVRAECLEQESALRGVSSDKRDPLERQFDLFSQANALLRARELGSFVFDVKFTDLDNLEAFWGDYMSGDLLEAVKGVFITDSLRIAAGTEDIRLLISVDEDDYEEGQRLLGPRMVHSNGGSTGTHWAG